MSGRFTYLAARRRGRASDIFDALDADGRPVVIKRQRSLDELGRRRFCREARLGKRLRHRGLAEIIDHGADWIAFEPLDVQPVFPQRALSEAETGRVIGTLAQTLTHLHACGVVHRDLKPAHVMFRGEEVVLIDLGVAGLAGEDPLEGDEIVGSPAWMAPEQMLGVPPAPSADIWSLSAVAYALVTGRRLYTGPADAVLKARRGGAIEQPDLTGIASGALAAAVAAGLAPAADRPSAAEIAASLADYWITSSTAG